MPFVMAILLSGIEKFVLKAKKANFFLFITNN